MYGSVFPLEWKRFELNSIPLIKQSSMLWLQTFWYVVVLLTTAVLISFIAVAAYLTDSLKELGGEQLFEASMKYCW